MSVTAVDGDYAAVNGLKMYYEIHGAGDPLVLLHGGFGTASMFKQLIPALAQTRQVIAPELQGHGHTADIDRPIRLESMADDVAALLAYLGIETADLFGYSMGGGVALQTAIRHPRLVRKLVIVSAPFKHSGWYSHLRPDSDSLNAEWARAMEGTPMHEAYRQVAPRPQDWPRLATKMGQSIGREYDWTAQIAALEAPTLIVVGDADLVRLDHALEMYTLLGGGKPDVQGSLPASQLAILPGVNHYTSFSRADLLLPILTPFLESQRPEGA